MIKSLTLALSLMALVPVYGYARPLHDGGGGGTGGLYILTSVIAKLPNGLREVKVGNPETLDEVTIYAHEEDFNYENGLFVLRSNFFQDI
jgi:hypothetical protein